MLGSRILTHTVGATSLLVFSAGVVSQAQQATSSAPSSSSKIPYPQKLTYRIEWRLITAGTANLDITRAGANAWEINLGLESAGLVNRLYHISDRYRVFTDGRFCASSANLDAQEGKRHMMTQLQFDNARHKVTYEERDLIKNKSEKRELDIPPCTHDIMGALAALSELDLEAGKAATLPITDGKKLVHARIEAQAKETVPAMGKNYQTIRYEAFVFDNVLYKRKGRLFLWLSDDPDRVPVQFRIQLGFPIGTISLSLEKQQKL
ncbi:MAG: DUF3108 domain-containing protein [Acidobacteriaceae bacterium]|nr:DUF3108 domain-containing protein [Acidobacteriaceae bacterium]